jgi:hypothetical protein
LLQRRRRLTGRYSLSNNSLLTYLFRAPTSSAAGPEPCVLPRCNAGHQHANMSTKHGLAGRAASTPPTLAKLAAQQALIFKASHAFLPVDSTRIRSVAQTAHRSHPRLYPLAAVVLALRLAPSPRCRPAHRPVRTPSTRSPPSASTQLTPANAVKQASPPEACLAGTSITRGRIAVPALASLQTLNYARAFSSGSLVGFATPTPGMTD